MTDMLSGHLLVEKTFTYMSAVTKECRKFLSTQFSQKHKGIPFDSVEAILKQEIESWFARRDKNIAINFEKSAHGRPGELLVTYSGATKDAHFKFHVDSLFTLAGSSEDAPAYLKNMNIDVRKDEFTK